MIKWLKASFASIFWTHKWVADEINYYGRRDCKVCGKVEYRYYTEEDFLGGCSTYWVVNVEGNKEKHYD